MKTKLIYFKGFTFEAYYHEDETGLTIDNLINVDTQVDYMDLIGDVYENELNRILAEELI